MKRRTHRPGGRGQRQGGQDGRGGGGGWGRAWAARRAGWHDRVLHRGWGRDSRGWRWSDRGLQVGRCFSSPSCCDFRQKKVEKLQLKNLAHTWELHPRWCGLQILCFAIFVMACVQIFDWSYVFNSILHYRKWNMEYWGVLSEDSLASSSYLLNMHGKCLLRYLI